MCLLISKKIREIRREIKLLEVKRKKTIIKMHQHLLVQVIILCNIHYLFVNLIHLVQETIDSEKLSARILFYSSQHLGFLYIIINILLQFHNSSGNIGILCIKNVFLVLFNINRMVEERRSDCFVAALFRSIREKLRVLINFQ